jgi:hypothetical protein
MAKKKLLIVVGAGASVEFGIPSVLQVNAIINSEVQKTHPLSIAKGSNLYAYIAELIERYWANAVPKPLFREPHFEDVLYAIFALAAAYPAGVHTSALGALIRVQWLPDILEFGRTLKHVGRNELGHLADVAVDAIVQGFRDRCIATERDKVGEFAKFGAFMSAMRDEFDVAVVTLNYDNVMYRAFPGIETGFDPTTGRFDRQRILARRDWPCMLHLHGSVHFDMPTPRGADMHEIHWQPNIAATFAQNALGRSSRSNPEGADFPTSVVVAGYGKTTQILRQPFRTYYSELDRLVSQCDAVLFTGYGFGDTHLNVAFERFRDGHPRPAVILGYASDGTMTLGSADPDNAVATAVVHTLHTDLRSMQWLGHSHPDLIDELRAAEEFEISSDSATPLSVWYNGMLAACDHPDRFLRQLR